MLDTKSELKATVDHIICSLCYCKPYLFLYLLHLVGIVQVMDWIGKFCLLISASVRSTGLFIVVKFVVIEISEGDTIENLLASWYDEICTWDRIQLCPSTEITNLVAGSLMTVGRAAQSPPAARLLEESRFLVHLNATIMSKLILQPCFLRNRCVILILDFMTDFWTHYTNKCTGPSSESLGSDPG